VPLNARLAAALLHLFQKPTDIDGDPQVRLYQFFYHILKSIQTSKDSGRRFAIPHSRDQLFKLNVILEDVTVFTAPDTDGIIFQADP
jgi:hypothetical protein